MLYTLLLLAQPIYLDYQASTPCDERVLQAMIPYFTKECGNPHAHHIYGQNAHKAVEEARAKVSRVLSAQEPHKIIFTSGATEANNLILKSLATYYKKRGRNHIITCQTEHKSVLDTCQYLETQGFKVTYLPVASSGLIDLQQLRKAITRKTFVVSIMFVNNEIGVIQPIAAIGQLCHDKNVIFHVDAVQAMGKIPVDVEALKIDALSLSGHKIYGPKGIAALYVREAVAKKMTPLVHGGGQEYGLRSGTVPVPLCVGLGATCELVSLADTSRIKGLRDYLYNSLKKDIKGLAINGDEKQRIAENLSIRVPKVGRVCKLYDLDQFVSLSAGSACSTGKPSHVIKALGIDESKHYILRISLGRMTTKEEMDETLKHLKIFFQ